MIKQVREWWYRKIVRAKLRQVSEKDPATLAFLEEFTKNALKENPNNKTTQPGDDTTLQYRAELFIRKFKVEDVVIAETGRVDLIATGKAPLNFDELIIENLLGKQLWNYKIMWVEHFATPPPWKAGSGIGLALKRLKT